MNLERLTFGCRWSRPSLSVVDVRVNDEPTTAAGAAGPASGSASAAAATASRGQSQSFYRYGPTRFSVIPKRAVGQVSVRFVPNQSSDVVVSAIKRHIEHEFFKLRSPNKLTVGGPFGSIPSRDLLE